MTEPSKQSGSDPVGDLQRWLVRSGARSVTRQLSGQIRTALGGGKQSTANVWETATTESDDSPECAWCPHCRARRLVRESGPGLGSGVAAAADAVGVVMRDAMSAFEAAVVAAGQQTKSRDTSAQPQDTTAQSRDTTAQSRDTTAQPPGEVWGEATDEPAVRTRPPANGHGGRQSGARPQSAGPKPASTGTSQPSSSSQPSGSEPPSAGAKPPSAGAKPPSAGAKPPSAGGPKPPSAGAKQASGAAKQATGAAKRPPAGPKKPAADAKKPAGRSGGTAATDRTPPDKPTPAKPDEPAG